MVRVVHLYLYAWKKTEWYNDEDKKKKKKASHNAPYGNSAADFNVMLLFSQNNNIASVPASNT